MNDDLPFNLLPQNINTVIHHLMPSPWIPFQFALLFLVILQICSFEEIIKTMHLMHGGECADVVRLF
jgi:hypothetical protein